MHFKYILQFAPAALAAVHTVDVGEDGLSFDPPTLTAAVGDKVIFTLYNDHNVAQSSFDKPCANDGGFFSGTFQNADNGAMRFVLTVNDTNPIYYYCSLPTHCQNKMVGGINVPSDGNTIEDYGDGAEKSGKSTVPSGLSGGVLVSESEASALASSSAAPSATGSGSGSSSASASATSSPTGGSSAAASSAAASSAAESSAAASSAAASSAATSSPSTPESTGAAAAVQLDSAAVLAAGAGLVAWFL